MARRAMLLLLATAAVAAPCLEVTPSRDNCTIVARCTVWPDEYLPLAESVNACVAGSERAVYILAEGGETVWFDANINLTCAGGGSKLFVLGPVTFSGEDAHVAYDTCYAFRRTTALAYGELPNAVPALISTSPGQSKTRRAIYMAVFGGVVLLGVGVAVFVSRRSANGRPTSVAPRARF